jgi:3-hydroxybutyryl-CoA dehydrogenase
MDIRAVAVIGLGTMGAGIAEVLARGGLTVTAVEVDDATLTRGLAHLDQSLAVAVARGKLTAEAKAGILGRVQPASSLAAAAGADLVIEAVPERLDIKHQVLAELDRICRPGAILATNTSSLSVTAIAAPTRHPGRVVGMHFFNPAPVMPLVEVITTVLTEPAVAAAVTGLAAQLGKRPVAVGDRAGFVANALLLPYLNHAVTLLESGYATREDIDTAARAGLGLPMGPLALLDLIGLDVSLSILEILQGELGGPRYRPAPLLRRMAAAGLAGRKTGRGFYAYPPGRTAPQARSQDIDNAAPGAGPAPVTVIDGGAGESAALAKLIEAAGRQVTALEVTALEVTGLEAAGLVIVAVPAAGGALAAALACGRPGDAVGLHLTGERLAELAVTPLSSPATIAAAAQLAAALGRDAVRCPDRPGLLAGALLYPHLGDAVRMLQDGYASAADIDTAMTAGCGYPRGPLRMLDDLGAGPVLAGLAAMHDCYGDPAFAPPPLLREHAAAALSFHG